MSFSSRHPSVVAVPPLGPSSGVTANTHGSTTRGHVDDNINHTAASSSGAPPLSAPPRPSIGSSASASIVSSPLCVEWRGVANEMYYCHDCAKMYRLGSGNGGSAAQVVTDSAGGGNGDDDDGVGHNNTINDNAAQSTLGGPVAVVVVEVCSQCRSPCVEVIETLAQYTALAHDTSSGVVSSGSSPVGRHSARAPPPPPLFDAAVMRSTNIENNTINTNRLMNGGHSPTAVVGTPNAMSTAPLFGRRSTATTAPPPSAADADAAVGAVTTPLRPSQSAVGTDSDRGRVGTAEAAEGVSGSGGAAPTVVPAPINMMASLSTSPSPTAARRFLAAAAAAAAMEEENGAVTAHAGGGPMSPNELDVARQQAGPSAVPQPLPPASAASALDERSRGSPTDGAAPPLTPQTSLLLRTRHPDGRITETTAEAVDGFATLLRDGVMSALRTLSYRHQPHIVIETRHTRNTATIATTATNNSAAAGAGVPSPTPPPAHPHGAHPPRGGGAPRAGPRARPWAEEEEDPSHHSRSRRGPEGNGSSSAAGSAQPIHPFEFLFGDAIRSALSGTATHSTNNHGNPSTAGTGTPTPVNSPITSVAGAGAEGSAPRHHANQPAAAAAAAVGGGVGGASVPSGVPAPSSSSSVPQHRVMSFAFDPLTGRFTPAPLPSSAEISAAMAGRGGAPINASMGVVGGGPMPPNPPHPYFGANMGAGAPPSMFGSTPAQSSTTLHPHPASPSSQQHQLPRGSASAPATPTGGGAGGGEGRGASGGGGVGTTDDPFANIIMGILGGLGSAAAAGGGAGGGAQQHEGADPFAALFGPPPPLFGSGGAQPNRGDGGAGGDGEELFGAGSPMGGVMSLQNLLHRLFMQHQPNSRPTPSAVIDALPTIEDPSMITPAMREANPHLDDPCAVCQEGLTAPFMVASPTAANAVGGTPTTSGPTAALLRAASHGRASIRSALRSAGPGRSAAATPVLPPHSPLQQFPPPPPATVAAGDGGGEQNDESISSPNARTSTHDAVDDPLSAVAGGNGGEGGGAAGAVLAESSPIIVLPCNHCYHKECLVPWLQRSQQCPICRRNVTGAANDDEEGSSDNANTANHPPAAAAPSTSSANSTNANANASVGVDPALSAASAAPMGDLYGAAATVGGGGERSRGGARSPARSPRRGGGGDGGGTGASASGAGSGSGTTPTVHHRVINLSDCVQQ